jgi:predicted dithiol-disulfide oxidoreductase (DUF899 family)
MTLPRIASREDWLAARRALLEQEKAHVRRQDELAAARRALPMVRIDKDYRFATPRGEASLADLFGPHSQLIVYHFMFGPDWEQGCPSCSFWADNFDGIDVHLAARDTAFAAVSNAPVAKLEDYRRRLGWRFRWVSAGGTSFGEDFGVTFPDTDGAPRPGYNYSDTVIGEEMPGVSVFVRLEDGTVCHSYSAYARGIEAFNGAYHLLDLTPKGRDEDGLPHTMAWVRRRDAY